MRIATHLETWAMSDFRANLVKYRKDRKLTQSQLAELLQVQPRLISRWETGNTRPQFDHMVRLAEVLQVSLDQLAKGDEVTGSPDFEIRNKRLEELCRQVDHLGKDDQDVICHVMDSLIRKERVKAILGATMPTAE
jgi:transcriptional regulator with XRE-family HTH domain